MADPEQLRRISAATGMGLQFLARDEKLSLALEGLRERMPGAVLKGGTALNRIHLAKRDASRFSEDIDLDIARKGAVSDVTEAGRRALNGIGAFDVEGPRRLHDTLRFDCLFTNEFGQRDRIRVEFHLGTTGRLGAEDILVKSPFVESHPTIFSVYVLEDLLAMKLVALRNRTEGKDIYDLYHGLDLEPLHRERHRPFHPREASAGLGNFHQEPGTEDKPADFWECQKRPRPKMNGKNGFDVGALVP